MSQPRKTFSLEQANNTLPLVSRVVGDIVRIHREMVDLYEKAQRLVEGGENDQAQKLQDRLQDLAYERAGYVEELEGIGCVFKDPNIGLVDFPARLDDRDVFLCWKLGEARIAYWHELHAGFKGRQPVENAF